MLFRACFGSNAGGEGPGEDFYSTKCIAQNSTVSMVERSTACVREGDQIVLKLTSEVKNFVLELQAKRCEVATK